MSRKRFLGTAIVAAGLCGCVSTSMQGYADRDLPTSPLSHVVSLVVAPPNLATAVQASLASEASKRGVVLEDARILFPPTRQYSAAEIKHDLASTGIDGVLIIQVGDSGIQQEYAGTVFSGGYNGTVNGTATVNTFGSLSTASYNGTVIGHSYETATPVYRYRRQTDFAARLIEPTNGRNLWVGSGQVNSGGALFVGNGVSASNSVTAIFNDLQAKRLIGPPS